VFEIGNSLRDARVRQGLELLDLEAETKIRAKYLRALEEEQFDQLPGDTYVKGFLRTYADRLGLDGQLYADEYNSRFSLAEEPQAAPRPRRQSPQRRRLESHAVLVALAGILAVTVLVIAAWQLTGSGEPPAPTSSTPAVTGGDTTGATDTAAADAEIATLVVTAAGGSSRVEVRRGSGAGELVWEGTITKSGESQRFTGKRLWVAVAKPANVRLTLNGELVAKLDPTATVLVVTAGGVKAASRAE
jgi:cytoskeletal protein RodZ